MYAYRSSPPIGDRELFGLVEAINGHPEVAAAPHEEVVLVILPVEQDPPAALVHRNSSKSLIS